MKNNFNQRERVIRALLALAAGGLGVSGYLGDTLLNSALAFISIVLLLTVVLNFCPVYKFLGISTSKTRRMTY